jgi:hypothetical protein
MSSTEVDEAMFARARAAMAAARAAEHAVLVVVGELAESGAWGATGHRNLPRCLAELWRVNDGHARRLVRHAAAVLPMVALTGQSLAERMPTAATATEAGEIGDEHLTVLVKAIDAVERIVGITPDQVTDAEQILGQAARTLTPRGLQKAVERLLATLDADGVAPDDGGDPTDEWQLIQRKDGTLSFTGRIRGAADVALLLETLDALCDPAGPDDDRSLAARRAEALLDLCAHALGCAGFAALDEDSDDEAEHAEPDGPEPDDGDLTGTPSFDTGSAGTECCHTAGAEDDTTCEDSGHDTRRLHLVPESESGSEPEPSEPPASPRRRAGRLPIPARAAVTVTVPLEWLREQRGHMLVGDTPADVADARRLACDAGVIPAVLGSRGEPLDIGRAAYAVPLALWRALLLRDRGCAHPGCRRRAGRCHAHHIRHWIDGGETCLENCVLLCRYHHHLVHHGGPQLPAPHHGAAA